MNTLDRGLVLIALAFCAATAAFMTAAPQIFYAAIPGVIESGPMNVHLIRDVGFAYAVFAIGFAASLRSRPVAKFASSGAALYLMAHAALHVTMNVAKPNTRIALGELPGVDLPAISRSRSRSASRGRGRNRRMLMGCNAGTSRR